MNIIKRFFPIIILLIISFFSISPLLQSGFFPMHDDTQVARIFEMAKSLKMGMFPVRWVADLGYGLGYPIFNFYAPFSYYFGAFFNLLGFDALVATKITIVMGVLLSAVSMYLLAKELFGKISGVTAASFYVYAPYHALDIFVRGDVAEFWAYAFIPLTFYGLVKIYKEKNFPFVFITALSFALLILSHNLTAMMVTPYLLFISLIMSIYLYKKKQAKTILYLFGSLLLGVIVSFFYWFPALFEMNSTNVMSVVGGGSHFADHFACISQLWSSPVGYGGSARGCVDGFSLMIGKLHILISFAAVIISSAFYIFKRGKVKSKELLIISLSFLGFVFSAFLTLEISKLVWQSTPLMAFFQFPWRFILMVSFFASFLAGAFVYLISFLPTKKIFPHFTIEVSAVLIIILLFLNVKLFVPQKILNVDANYYTNEYSLKWTTSKISDEYLPKNTKKPLNANEALRNTQKFEFRQTKAEIFSNVVSLTGIFIIVIGIIKFRKKYE